MVDITDWNDLDAAIQGTNGSEDTGDYVLQNDLDSDTAGYSGVGDSWQPCGINATGSSETGFQGTFDGNGFEIRDLVIDDNSHDTTENNIGLFGSTAGGDGTTIIENLGVGGSVTTSGDIDGIGIVVGVLRNTDGVSNLYSFGDVTGSNSSSLRIGGLIGFADSGQSISNCYSLADVTGPRAIGGFIGRNEATISTSYSAGLVDDTGSTDIGGFVGNSLGSQTDTYWDTEASGQSTSAGSATGLTTSEMQGSSASTNLSGFDFTGTWETVESTDPFTTADGYPILQAITPSTQKETQGVSTTETLTGTITQSGSGVENAYVFVVSRPNDDFEGTVLTDANGDYSIEIPERATPPFEVAVGVDFDDGTDKFGRAKTILFDP